jgi:DNA repair protein RecO (recombination protein O)
MSPYIWDLRKDLLGGERMASTPYIVTKGIVLRETETKEADKILTLLTQEQGKIPVIARGVRRKGCKYAACAQPLVYSEWTLYRKGDWYYANEGTTIELFRGLQNDLDAMALGFYMAELTEAVAVEETTDASELLRHLLNGLYALAVLHRPRELVKAAFEVKLLSLAGYEPLIDSCAYCGNPVPESPLLDVVQGVLRCRKCGVQESGLSMPLCSDSLAALRYVIYGNPKKLYSFELSGEALQKFSSVAETFVATQLERGFRSLDFYKSLQPVKLPHEM